MGPGPRDGVKASVGVKVRVRVRVRVTVSVRLRVMLTVRVRLRLRVIPWSVCLASRRAPCHGGGAALAARAGPDRPGKPSGGRVRLG